MILYFIIYISGVIAHYLLFRYTNKKYLWYDYAAVAANVLFSIAGSWAAFFVTLYFYVLEYTESTKMKPPKWL